ncbi:Phage major capsid protein [Devosia sp. DBB001]|nr:Phage major capsid protein [Devosia sp. DBB001]
MLSKRPAMLFGGLFLCLAVAAIAALVNFHFPDAGHVVASLFDPANPHAMLANISLAALRAERLDVHNKMKAIVSGAEGANRDLTAEETTEFDALKAQRDALDARISRAEDLDATDEALSATVPARSRQANIPRAGGPEANREFESLGQFLYSVRFNQNDQRLSTLFNENVGAIGIDGELSAEMRMDNDTQGGFMVPQQFQSSIMSVSPQESLVRSRATVIPAGSPPDAGITIPALNQEGNADGHVFGGMTFDWIEEGGDKPETDAELAGVGLTPHEIAGHVPVTDKLLRNWQASGAFIERLMRGGVTAAEDYAFLRGNGVAKPLGVLNAPATKYINRALANKITYADTVEMVARLLMRGGSPVWSMPQSALPQIAELKDESGRFIWKPDARDGFAGTLHGYPVRWNNRQPGLGSKGDVLLADLSYYLIKDGSGPFVAASEHVKFLQNKTVIKIFWNVDGAPWLKAPFAEENGYEVSPFIGLDIPA